MRLLTGELHQGALAGVMADAIARAAGVPAAAVRRAAMLGGDLADTARRALEGGSAALAAVRLQVLRPVQPMLAASAASVGEALAATGPASVEWKLDGARIQVHRRGDDVRVFTRNLNDVTARLPEVVEVARGSCRPRTFVLDGEAIGLADDALPRRFQDTMSRFGRDDAATHTLDARRVLLRRAASRRRRPARPPARPTRRDPRRPRRRVARAGDRDRRRRTAPRRSSPSRSRPGTRA